MIKINIKVCQKCDWYHKQIISSTIGLDGNIVKNYDKMCIKNKSFGGYLIEDGLPVPEICKCKLEHIVLENGKVKEI